MHPVNPGTIAVSSHSDKFYFVFTDPAFSKCHPRRNMKPVFIEVTVQMTLHLNKLYVQFLTLENGKSTLAMKRKNVPSITTVLMSYPLQSGVLHVLAYSQAIVGHRQKNI